LTRQRVGVVFLLVLLACTHASKPEGDLGHSGELTGIPIANGLAGIDSDHAKFIRLAVANVPAPLPVEAVSLLKFVIGEETSGHGLRFLRVTGSDLNTKVVVADPGSNSVHLKLLCLRNFHQVSCSPTASFWRITLPPSSIVQAPVTFDVTQGDRLDFLLIVAGDLSRPEPASADVPISVGPSHPSQVEAEGSGHASVFGGCDFATIVTRTSFQATFHKPGKQTASTPLFLVVQPCERDSKSEEVTIRAAAVVDGSSVVSLPGLDSFVRFVGPAMVQPIAGISLTPGSEIQMVVFRADKPAWITHPVDLT